MFIYLFYTSITDSEYLHSFKSCFVAAENDIFTTSWGVPMLYEHSVACLRRGGYEMGVVHTDIFPMIGWRGYSLPIGCVFGGGTLPTDPYITLGWVRGTSTCSLLNAAMTLNWRLYDKHGDLA